MEHGKASIHLGVWLTCAAVLAAACDGESHVASRGAALSVECVQDDALPPDAWVCPASRTLDCGEVDDATLYVVETEGVTCAGETLKLSDSGPFLPGTHSLTVSDADGEAECTAELTVVDDGAPALAPRSIQLWPPNHALHEISIADCVAPSDACDPDLTAAFIWASSDEPVDGIGDGHHAPDIVVSDDCQSVSVRAERKGPGDGRVYRLGVRVTDDAGNVSEGECMVIVDHDQRGATGADSGEVYRVVFDGSDGGPACGGVSEPPAGGEEDAGVDGDAAGARSRG